MHTMPGVLITGANRGIGLEHARQFVQRGWLVHACARNPEQAHELLELQSNGLAGQLLLHPLEVTDHAAVDHLAARLQGQPLDIVVNNAGTFGPAGAPAGMAYQSLDNMDYGIWRQILEVNLLAPFKVAQAFRPHLALARRGLLVMMSSGLASIEQCSGHSYAYRSSKAGLNIISRGMAAEWPDITVVAMAPGWCRTDLGGAEAPVETADSVRDQQLCFDRLSQADSGRFIDQHGQTVPW